jgi:hypothetical protein
MEPSVAEPAWKTLGHVDRGGENQAIQEKGRGRVQSQGFYQTEGMVLGKQFCVARAEPR